MKTTLRFKRRAFAAVVAAAAILTPVVAAPASMAADPVELTFWSWRTEDVDFYNAQLKKFTDKNPDIKVKFTAYLNTEYNGILSSALAAGKGPDIMFHRPHGAGAVNADAGYLLPLTKNEVPALASFSPALLDGAKGYVDRQVFGVPFATSAVGMYYNPTLLKKAKVTKVPTTWPDFIAALKKIKAAGIIPIAEGTGNGPQLEQMWGAIAPTFYGGTAFFNDTQFGRKTFTNKAFVSSLTAMKELLPYMPPNASGVDYNAGRANFWSGKAAFFFGGSFELGYFRSNNPNIDVAFTAAPAAKKGARQYVSSWADGSFAVNAKTANKEAALKVLNFLASKEFGQALANQLDWISAVPGTAIYDSVVKQIAAEIKKSTTPYLMLVGYRYQNPSGSTMLQNGLQAMYANQKTPQYLASEIQTGIASWYLPQKGKS